MDNRRTSRRLSVHFPASLKAGKLTAEGAIRQISENGMLFECSKHFDA
ncbi:MAG: PilZ domain-containing protein [Deltaproteobacteria bacterium]|nr:PilZ domain-containing protein [Deltaproteobacteria bacterium]